jgi:hypothetical protein
LPEIENNTSWQPKKRFQLPNYWQSKVISCHTNGKLKMVFSHHQKNLHNWMATKIFQSPSEKTSFLDDDQIFWS